MSMCKYLWLTDLYSSHATQLESSFDFGHIKILGKNRLQICECIVSESAAYQLIRALANRIHPSYR